MKKNYFLILYLILYTLLPSGVSASCAGPLNIRDNMDMADTVAVGTVTGDFFGNYSKFEVDYYYKGTGPGTIAVRGRELDSSITSVDYELENGKTYLLFLRKVDDISYKTNACAGNRRADTANSALFTSEEALVLGSGTPPDSSKDNALISENNWGWLIAIVGYGYVLPALLALALVYSAYVLYRFIRSMRVRNYHILLLVISIVYAIFYFYIQRVI